MLHYPATAGFFFIQGDVMQSDGLTKFWAAVVEFHGHFDTAKWQSIEAAFTCALEELNELGRGVIDGDRANAAEELADLLFTGVALARRAGVTLDEFNAALDLVAAKNRLKFMTHEADVAAGKVKRKKQAGV